MQEESPDTVKRRMEAANPIIIARNHRVEEALEAATNEADFSVMERLLAALMNPYDYRETNACMVDAYFTEPSTSGKAYRTFCGT
jgi:uncharacterized protein YdiU (UPF0061 family)